MYRPLRLLPVLLRALHLVQDDFCMMTRFKHHQRRWWFWLIQPFQAYLGMQVAKTMTQLQAT